MHTSCLIYRENREGTQVETRQRERHTTWQEGKGRQGGRENRETKLGERKE